MAKAKYSILFFLFFAVFLFTGESYTYFLENFQDSYTQIGYFLSAGESEEAMNRHILQQADAFDTVVFALDKTEAGAFSRTIIIYGDASVQEHLERDWNIKPGTVKSFFSGTTTFRFEPFESATEKIMQNCWYPDKSPDELYDMVFPGMADYSGAFRNDPICATSKLVVTGVWVLVLLTTLLLTAYDVTYEKKEQYIRIVLGADNNQMRLRKVLADLAGLSVSALLAFLLLLPFTTPEFELPIALLCFAVLLVANGVLILKKMKLRKNQPMKASLSNEALGMSIGLKGLVAILTVVALSAAIGLSVEGVKLYAQKSNYDAQSDVIHVDISYPYDYEKMEMAAEVSDDRSLLDTKAQVQDNFLRYSYKNLDCSLLYSHSYEKVAPKYGDKYVYANLQGLRRYQESIPDWAELCLTEGNYLLISENENEAAVLAELYSFGNILGIREDTLDGVFTYRDNLSVISEGRRDGEYDYSYRTKNPVILLDTYDYGKLPTYPVSFSLRESENMGGILSQNAPFLMQFVALKGDSAQLDAFAALCGGDAIHPNLMEFSTENVKDWYNGLWALQNRGLLIAIVLTLLLLVLEVQITTLVLRIAYETHAKELTVKKVLGYSLPERFGSFFLLSGAVCGASLAAALVLFLLLKVGVIQYMIYGSLIIWLTDWAILLVLTRKGDKAQIQRVLKGGI